MPDGNGCMRQFTDPDLKKNLQHEIGVVQVEESSRAMVR
jgi:hypothetical protein